MLKTPTTGLLSCDISRLWGRGRHVEANSPQPNSPRTAVPTSHRWAPQKRVPARWTELRLWVVTLHRPKVSLTHNLVPSNAKELYAVPPRLTRRKSSHNSKKAIQTTSTTTSLLLSDFASDKPKTRTMCKWPAQPANLILIWTSSLWGRPKFPRKPAILNSRAPLMWPKQVVSPWIRVVKILAVKLRTLKPRISWKESAFSTNKDKWPRINQTTPSPMLLNRSTACNSRNLRALDVWSELEHKIKRGRVWICTFPDNSKFKPFKIQIKVVESKSEHRANSLKSEKSKVKNKFQSPYFSIKKGFKLIFTKCDWQTNNLALSL